MWRDAAGVITVVIAVVGAIVSWRASGRSDTREDFKVLKDELRARLVEAETDAASARADAAEVRAQVATLSRRVDELTNALEMEETRSERLNARVQQLQQAMTTAGVPIPAPLYSL